jgi:transposase
MSKVIMIGCDLHDAKMVLKLCCDSGTAVRKSWVTSEVDELIEYLRSFAAERGAQRIVFAYEASGQGFGLYDRLTEAGIECHVLAPTHLPHTAHGRKNKTDDKDAQMILEELRAHVLAGRKLPDVWVPSPQTRSDRELVRWRLELCEQRTRLKNQIQNLLKRNQRSLPVWFSKSGDWSKRSMQWLHDQASDPSGEAEAKVLDGCVRSTLGSLIRLYERMCEERKELDKAILELAGTDRYRQAFRKLKLQKGVGTLTAMVFLTELGELDRFANRRDLSAYLGLAPSAFESGQRDDRKGHITRQGPSRVRHVLCQASWSAIRYSEHWREKYDRIRRDSSKRSKVAIVAVMRLLAITMWQAARSKELDEVLLEQDRVQAAKPKRRTPASARARQKGATPSAVAVTSP